MKSFKFNTSCAIVLITLLLFGQGCSDDKESDIPITIPSTEDTQPTLQKDGGSTTFSFNAPQAWSVSVRETTATRSASWLKVHPTSGAAGDATITITAEPNATGEPRTAEVTIRSGSQTETVTVTQDYSNFITLEQREIVAGSEEQTVTLDITSTMEYEVLIPDSVDWITDGGNTRAVTTHSHTLTIAANSSYDPRQTEIVFRGKTDATLADTVKVYQAYKGAIVVAKNEYEVDAVGGALDFKVQTNLDLEVTVSADWIKQVQGRTRGLVEKDLFFDISPNESDSVGREATITIKGKDTGISQDILVRQTAYVPVLDTVIYRTGYTWEEAHDNLPLLYYAHVERERHYTNGKVYTDRFVDNGHPADVKVSIATELDTYPKNEPSEGTVIYDKHNGYKDSITYSRGEIFENDSIRIVHCSAIISANPTESETDIFDGNRNNIPEEWNNYVVSKLYDTSVNITQKVVDGLPLSLKAPGWYFQNLTYDNILQILLPDGVKPIFSSYVDVNQYDQYLSIDNKRIDFTKYYPNRENKYATEDLPATDSHGIGKRYIHECIVNFLGRNFYSSSIMDVYQCKYDLDRTYILGDCLALSDEYNIPKNEHIESIRLLSNKSIIGVSDVNWITYTGTNKKEKSTLYSAPGQFDAYEWDIQFNIQSNQDEKERVGHIYLKDDKGNTVKCITLTQRY